MAEAVTDDANDVIVQQSKVGDEVQIHAMESDEDEMIIQLIKPAKQMKVEVK